MYIKPNVTKEDDYVEVVGDGVKTYTTLLNELFQLVDQDKITNHTVFEDIRSEGTRHIYTCQLIKKNNTLCYQKTYLTASQYEVYYYSLGESSTKYSCVTSASGTTFTNNSSDVVSSGQILRVYY